MTASKAPLTLVDHDEADEIYHLQDQVGFVLRKAHQRHLSIFASRIADLTPPQFAALARLHEVGETSQNQLGQMIAMDAATVKGVIDRLKSRGYVDLKKHETDKRLLLVSLTAAGRKAIEQLIPLAKAITGETLAPLSAREAAQFLRLLAKIA
ncbi:MULTISPECIES: MarR family winged helix-turn-helix transcriptional regulator [Phyllobacteriaceae]|jgi:DNA-binding MarR family transcriptional regulator|uniref:MarR family transcriptional regulator n=1 Tax=Mesorhizobium hungaricum TaxID=1566387 RepID=A0A1C2DDZ5_9HYPH|nr:MULTISPECIES: MarR family transcriptional regulator [Mesorhizobium]MBN9233045.1 MarR family transcriptional regulator [Mesorhizobium sp.]MDQ0330597.1 DNA-binding MarR family transcriptional regulator [Mesorhizobium sp. YL-MeA3-2017]OCX12947.1 MarR family transcriptional regulator [Mesorhizobium hungaricum]